MPYPADKVIWPLNNWGLGVTMHFSEITFSFSLEKKAAIHCFVYKAFLELLSFNNYL